MKKVHISRFTPSLMDHETLEAIFVQREELAVDTVDRIHESVLLGNKHYMLFIGPRGCGKTHFVSLVFHRLKRIEDLRDELRVAWLNEDKTSTSVLDLNRRIYETLSADHPVEFPKDRLEALYDRPPADAATYMQELLTERLGDKSALIIVENLDALFENFGRQGQHDWRAFLQGSGKFTILATAQQLFPGVSDRNLPFYGFFQTAYLKPLSVQDGRELLKNIATQQEDKELAGFLDTPEGRSRVRTLHHLSGGNHRVYVVFSEFINRKSLDELVTPFEKTLDELTPYYQERLRWLTPQQRMIIEHLCTCDRALPVKEIARALFASNQTISKQLTELKQKRYVRSAKRGRESLYELTEPLMRLSMELKENRGGPIRLIVDFLRVWYSREELQIRLGSLSDTERMERSLRLNPDDAHANFARVKTMLSSGQWTNGWAEAENCLKRFPPQTVPTGFARGTLRIVFCSSQQLNLWSERVAKLCGLFDGVDALAYVAEGLVRTLRFPEIEQASGDLLSRWQAAWHQVVMQYDELSFALRLFDTGIEYLTTREPNVLLDLPVEQRAILEQLFDIDVTPASESTPGQRTRVRR